MAGREYIGGCEVEAFLIFTNDDSYDDGDDYDPERHYDFNRHDDDADDADRDDSASSDAGDCPTASGGGGIGTVTHVKPSSYEARA